ncbi:hypothetical protein DFH08DRAFT_937603 [Mycena albidolilacea]|uniref:Uncharacterized protein n=1 Tax=Mycena albidolilacea TaxID=1033008 RepID=A0AAD7ER21_9AGAR|nr:hypothetical protein DFH08DRAFT_937603 [Mycena albidolilacea]
MSNTGCAPGRASPQKLAPQPLVRLQQQRLHPQFQPRSAKNVHEPANGSGEGDSRSAVRGAPARMRWCRRRGRRNTSGRYVHKIIEDAGGKRGGVGLECRVQPQRCDEASLDWRRRRGQWTKGRGGRLDGVSALRIRRKIQSSGARGPRLRCAMQAVTSTDMEFRDVPAHYGLTKDVRQTQDKREHEKGAKSRVTPSRTRSERAEI